MARKPYTQLRMPMVECGVTQSEMAHELGVCGTFISERMLGKRPFDTDMIQAIGSMLNIQPEDYHKFFFETRPGGRGNQKVK